MVLTSLQFCVIPGHNLNLALEYSGNRIKKFVEREKRWWVDHSDERHTPPQL